MYSETDKAYLAGLIDGEGHIGIVLQASSGRQRTSIHRLRVQVTNTAIDVLRGITKDFGGSYEMPPRKRDNPNWKPCITVVWTAAQAVRILKEVQPYLRIKAKHGLVGLEFAETIRSANGKSVRINETEWANRETLRLQLRELNRRGGAPDAKIQPWPGLGVQWECVECHTLFAATRKRKYCSTRCRHQVNFRNYQQGHIHECPVCGKSFGASRPEQIQCSHRCASLARWEQFRQLGLVKPRTTE